MDLRQFNEWSLFSLLTDRFFILLSIDLFFITILIHFIFFRKYKDKDLQFAFYLFNLIIFSITYMLNQIEISIGAAFGLFAIFTLLRYRTEVMDAKHMTYLFLSIAIGLITAISNKAYFDLVIINTAILFYVCILDLNWLTRNELKRIIHYDNLDLLAKDKAQELKSDLQKRTGINISHLNVEGINYRDGFAVIIVYYDERKNIPEILR